MLNAIERFIAAQAAADRVADWKTERATWLAIFDSSIAIAEGRPLKVRVFGKRTRQT